VKEIDSNTAQNMGAVWLITLVVLGVPRFIHIHSGDAWDEMLSRPAGLILGPLLAACIPLIARKQLLAARSELIEDGSAEDARPHWNIKSSTAWKMLLTWLVALVIFAVPHNLDTWDPILHRPAILILAPLLIGCIPLIFPARR
jgi:hypothetical protein